MPDNSYLRLLEGPLPLEAYEAAAQPGDLRLDHPSVERVARLILTLENYQYDNLTGLLKRDPFMNKLRARINDLQTGGNDANQSYGKSFLVMLDIKGLHDINKKEGHPGGDVKIKTVGQKIDQIILPGDEMEATAARLGGDEYALLVSYDSDLISLEDASQRIYARLEAMMTGDKEFPALRIGKVAELGSVREVIDLFKEADPKAPQTMRERVAKKIGRIVPGLKKQPANLRNVA